MHPGQEGAGTTGAAPVTRPGCTTSWARLLLVECRAATSTATASAIADGWRPATGYYTWSSCADGRRRTGMARCDPLTRLRLGRGGRRDGRSTDCDALRQPRASFDSRRSCGSTSRPATSTSAACCAVDGGCSFTDSVRDFAAAGGAFEGDGTICFPNNCPQPLGACCTGDGTCSEDTAAACAASGGVYQGDFDRLYPQYVYASPRVWQRCGRSRSEVCDGTADACVSWPLPG